MHILVSNYETAAEGYKTVKTIEEVYEIVCNNNVEDVFYHVGKPAVIDIDVIYQFITIVSKVNNIYVVDNTSSYNRVLCELGIKHCGVYLNEYIDTVDDFEFIRQSSDMIVAEKNTVIIDSLVTNIESAKNGVNRLIRFCEGSIGYFEVTEEDKINCNKFDYVINEVVKFLIRYKKENEKVDVFSPVIKLMADNIFRMKEGYSKELVNSGRLQKELDRVNKRYDDLTFDYNLYKENSKLFLFPTPYIVKKGKKTKVLYVKEFGRCSYLASMLFNFRLFLTTVIKNSTSLFVICQHNYGIQEERIKNLKNVVNLSTTELSSIEKLDTVPVAYMFEQNEKVWDNLLNYGFNFIVVLDRFYVANQILTMSNDKVGIELFAVNSTRDILNFNLDVNKVIMSVESQGRYLIPYMEGYRGKKSAIQYSMYLEKMGVVFREWSRRLT